MAHAKHEQVRCRYSQRCGYCGVSEIDAGGELTIDHYRPVATGGNESDENLVYACFRCNHYKADFFPSAEHLAVGRRILHPRYDDVTVHVRENRETGELEPLSETGRCHIALLHLNRPALVQYRLWQRTALKMAEAFACIKAENERLRATQAAQEVYIAHLRRLLELSDEEAE